MSSYSFQGHKRIWTPRDEEENRAIFSTRRQETGIKMPNEFKAVYYAHEEYEVEKWSVKRLIQLLRMYGAHRCLWDVRDPDNGNRKLRKAALIDITAAMGEGVTQAQVLQKINVLRATYRYEKRRIKQRIRKGIGAKTKLKWFALADAFLRNVPKPAEYRRCEPADSDSDLGDTMVFAIDPETLVPLEEEEEAVRGANAATLQKQEIKIKQEQMDVSSGLSTPVYVPECLAENIVETCPKTPIDMQIKEELIDVPVEEPQAVVLKNLWQPSDSLQFVGLLKEHPILWRNEPAATAAEQTKAFADIANAMQLPVRRVQKRVHTFRRACANELVKMSTNKHYKPAFVWWPIAASFMATAVSEAAEQKEEENDETLPLYTESEHFVDANEPPPPTPMNMLHMSIKHEKAATTADMCPQTPINPIPSVSSMLPCMEEDFDALFNEAPSLEDADLKAPSSVYHSNTIETANTTNNTKLVWNGLEDDLLEGKWSLKHSVKFLRLYGAHRCLWDLNDPDYRTRELRYAAIEDIAAAMGYGLDADYVSKKIKIFRITYMQHRKRMLEAIKEGKQPEIQLRWFPLADSFLRPHIGLRCIKEHEREMPQFDFQYVYANLNLIDPALLTDFRGKGTQNTIEIGATTTREYQVKAEQQQIGERGEEMVIKQEQL